MIYTTFAISVQWNTECDWLLWLWHGKTGRLSSVHHTIRSSIHWPIWPADLELEAEYKRFCTCRRYTCSRVFFARVYTYTSIWVVSSCPWCVLLFPALRQRPLCITFDCRQSHWKIEHVLQIECSYATSMSYDTLHIRDWKIGIAQKPGSVRFNKNRENR
jgi:hypothetical protein